MKDSRHLICEINRNGGYTLTDGDDRVTLAFGSCKEPDPLNKGQFRFNPNVAWHHMLRRFNLPGLGVDSESVKIMLDKTRT